MPRSRSRKRRGKCWISAGRGFQCLFRGYKRLDKKVMIELSSVKNISHKHIFKRWPRDARDILPDHFVRYQKDRGQPSSDTYRHNAMYIKALDCVLLGDTNVKCYDVFMAMMKEVYATLLLLSQEKDGMGLVEREAAAKIINGNAYSDTAPPTRIMLDDWRTIKLFWNSTVEFEAFVWTTNNKQR